MVGKWKYVESLTAHTDIAMQIHNNAKSRDPDFMEGDMILEADIPKGIIVLSENEGIDPYQFLNLTRQ